MSVADCEPLRCSMMSKFSLKPSFRVCQVLFEQVGQLHGLGLTRGCTSLSSVTVIPFCNELILVQSEAIMEGAPCELGLLDACAYGCTKPAESPKYDWKLESFW
jgi:hypothetical protein